MENGPTDLEVVVAMNDYIGDLAVDDENFKTAVERLAERYPHASVDDIEERVEDMVWDSEYLSTVKRYFGTLTPKGESLLRSHGIEPARLDD